MKNAGIIRNNDVSYTNIVKKSIKSILKTETLPHCKKVCMDRSINFLAWGTVTCTVKY